MKPKSLLWGSLHTVRNYFAIAFTLVYLTLTVGVAKTTHYCMGQENSTSIFSFEADPCACVLYAQVPMSCCSDSHELVALDDDHAASAVLHMPAPDFAFLGNVIQPLELEPVALTSSASPAFEGYNLPPPAVPLYQSHCSLVFYDEVG